jgi:nucleotide-binding universal stress UspA family protein
MQSRATHSPGPAFRVVVGIDFSTAGSGAMARALAIASAQPNGEVHAVSVVDSESPARGRDLPADAAAQLQELAKSAVTQLARAGAAANIRRVVTHFLTGSPAREIVWLATHLDAELIVVGTHGRRGAQRVMLGSVAEQVVRTAGCMVLVDRPKDHPREWKAADSEPPCIDCVARRKATSGVELWCGRHAGQHPHVNVYP